jgi:hypothetical protein
VKRIIAATAVLIITAAVMMMPVGGMLEPEGGLEMPPEVEAMDLSSHSAAPPGRPLEVLFIHHSCGGQLLAEPGPAEGAQGIHASHPNGGGLRRLLEEQGYTIHEASYGSAIGESTDIFDWIPKFSGRMDIILACAGQDDRHPEGVRNDIVLFKPCYPNNAFVSEGTPPGDPDGPDLTIWNAKAAYSPLLDEFRKHPGVLFVCFTAPPLAPGLKPEPLWKGIARVILGRKRDLAGSGRLAREFNNWLKDGEGWLADYEPANVVVFDYYDILTGGGRSNLSVFATGGGYDSHPGSEGNGLAARAFVPFLNRAVRRAGLAD